MCKLLFWKSLKQLFVLTYISKASLEIELSILKSEKMMSCSIILYRAVLILT